MYRQHGEAYTNKDFEQTLYHVTKTGRSMSHFPRYGIEDIAHTEPGYEVRISNNVVHVATNDVPANQNFLCLKIPHFSSNGVAAVVKAGLWTRWMLLRSLSASSPNQSPLPATSGTLFATSFRCSQLPSAPCRDGAACRSISSSVKLNFRRMLTTFASYSRSMPRGWLAMMFPGLCSGPRSGMIGFRSWRRFRGSTLRRAGGCCWHAAIMRLPGVLDCAQ